MERQLTFDARNKLLTHTNVWSPDGQWIVYDTRSDEAGSVFDGCTIEAVHVATGEQRVLYRTDVEVPGESTDGAHVGVVTCHPSEMAVAFIHGPSHPTPDWAYGAAHRQGVKVFMAQPGVAHAIDARDLSAATPGALRGGSHVHVWHQTLALMSFTYDDALVSAGRNVALALTDRNVSVPTGIALPPKAHSLAATRNHPGHAFTVLATRSVPNPRPGSDEYSRAFEEGWCNFGHSLAFVGEVRAADGRPVNEVFALDLPADLNDLTRAAPRRPLQGTTTDLPWPPDCLTKTTRRLTRFAEKPGHAGVSVAGSGVRHWLRGSPLTGEVAFLAADDRGVVQLWLVAADGNGPPRMLTHGESAVSSAFSFLPDGSAIAHTLAGRLAVTHLAPDARTGQTRLLETSGPVLPYCVCPSPDGRHLAYLRRVSGPNVGMINEIFTIDIDT